MDLEMLALIGIVLFVNVNNKRSELLTKSQQNSSMLLNENFRLNLY